MILFVVTDPGGEGEVATSVQELMSEIESLKNEVNTLKSTENYPQASGSALETRTTTAEGKIAALETFKNDTLGTVYSTSDLVNTSVPPADTTTACELTLSVPGLYLLYGTVGGSTWGSNGDMSCRFGNSDINTFYSSNYLHTSKNCSAASYVTINEEKIITFKIYQRNAETKPITSCSIHAVRIK